jgi:hypothetical protein
MSYQPTINVDGSGKDGAMVCWDAGDLKVNDLHDALKEIGCQGLGPKSSVLAAALADSFSGFLDRVPKLKEWGKPVKLFRLSPEVVGWNARKINPENEDIDPVFVASVVLDDKGVPRIVKHNPDLLPQVDAKKADIEAVINKLYQQRCGFYPTNMVTECFNKVVKSLGGILIKKTGGVFFIPEKGIEDFEKFARALDGKGSVELVSVRFPVVPTERSYATVLRSVKSIAKERLRAVEAGLQELGTSKKMRANGRESRLKECHDVLDMIKDYEEILGVDLPEIRGLVTKVEDAINVHSAMEFCA